MRFLKVRVSPVKLSKPPNFVISGKRDLGTFRPLNRKKSVSRSGDHENRIYERPTHLTPESQRGSVTRVHFDHILGHRVVLVRLDDDRRQREISQGGHGRLHGGVDHIAVVVQAHYVHVDDPAPEKDPNFIFHAPLTRRKVV